MANVSDYLNVNDPQIKKQAEAYGITPQQMLDIMKQPGYLGTPTSGRPAGQFLGGSSVTSATTDPGPGQMQAQTGQTLGLLKTLGITGGGNQQQGTPTVDPTTAMQTMNAMGNLGRAALGQDYTIINPTPGQGNMSEGGVNPVQQASLAKGWDVGSQYTNNPIGGVFNKAQSMSPSGLPPMPSTAEMQQYFADQAGSKMGAIKPSEINPDVAATYYKAMHPELTQPKPAFTPTTPATAAAFSPTPTPFAQAPAAPGLSTASPAPLNMGALGQAGGQAQAGPPGPADANWGAVAAHTQGLEAAGKALYAHFGGDPNNATPEHIADFHAQVQNALTTGAPIKRMNSGGLVPGRGNQDSVPALLTPGEYVIPKAQVPQFFGNNAPIRMQSGGLVPDNQDQDKKTPPEVRRKHLTPPGSPPPAPSQASQQPTQQGSSQASTADKGQQPQQQGYWSNLVNQAQAQRALSGAGASAANNYADIGGTGYGSPMSIESPIGQSPSMAGALGPSTASKVAGVADIAGGLISGLANAAKTYADSIKPWQMIQQKFGQAPPPNYQTVNLQQDEVA